MQNDWSASAELNRMRSAGITLPRNPIAGRVAARDMLNRAATPGAMLNELGPMFTNSGRPPEGRTRLNGLGSDFLAENGMSRTQNRRTAAATGNDAQWALPKLHDPFEYWRERCVLPGEEITLLDGPKKIEDVTYGDQALTHMGRYRRVLDLGNQEYEGKVYQLKPRYRTAINVTADHPIWTLREDGGQFIHVQDLKPNDKILFPVDRRIEDKEFIDLTEVIDHSDLVIENGYFTRKLSEKYGAEPKRLRGKPGRPINQLPVKIELTDDFLWFLGLYIAEGSTGGPDNKTVSIALSTKETELINRAINVLEKLTGKVAAIRDHTKYGDNSVSVELANIPLSRALPILCGKSSYNKHFPEWAQFLPEDKQKALLRGYFDGDGCYQPDISSCFTSSNHLRDQILQMMARNGFFPSVYHRTTKSFSKKIDGKNIVLSRTENSAFLHWMDIHIFDEIDDDVVVKRGRKYPIEHVAEGVWIPVEEIIESDYKGLIYSLTITEDHSYCVSGIGTRNTWWFNMEDPDEQTRKIRDWARLLYTTHHLVPSLIDIYTRFPLLDIELTHKDKRISDFYNDLFFDGLNYQEFLFNMGREFWTVGEVFAMGSWHDGIGAWEEDEIINPNDVIVAKNRALRTYQYHVKVPEEIKRLIERRDPPQEYAMLMQLYPDVVAWARQDKEIPVSDVIMKQLSFQTNPWSEHGTPILLRAFRMLMLEESLNAAQDAIADRLYSPLILATLGLPDVDGDGPWVPTAQELSSLRDDLAMAINSDFRLMTYHHGLKIENAFGRESMPRLDTDFLRVQTNVMGVFGIGSDLIQGGQGGTYASGALNRELITQMLSTYQHKIEKFIRSRMEPVAERQGHYEMRNVGGQMVPVMETVLMVDEETGEEFVEERPKLAIPEVRFRSMNLRDETIERQFMENLGAAGFPISLATRAVNIPIDFDDELEATLEEKIKTVVAEQRFKKEVFDRLYTLGYPIPPEYVQEYQAYLAMMEDPSLGAQLAPGAITGLGSPPSAPNLTGDSPQASDAAEGAAVFPMINAAAQPRQRPEISYEQRASQPKLPKGGRPNGPQKTASVAGWENEEDDFEPFERITYGERMKFSVPFEQKKRKRMKLAKGMKIIIDDSYEKFDEGEFKQHLASILDEPLITEPTNLDEHSSGDGGMDQPARKQINPEEEGL